MALNIMEQPTGYHAKLLELSTELVNHGWGEITVKVSSPFKDNKTQVLVICGKQDVFFIKKDIRFDKGNLL